MQQVSLEQKHAKEREETERKMLLLEIENRLLKAQLQLPPAKRPPDDDEKE
jgi:hypothetical protein